MMVRVYCDLNGTNVINCDFIDVCENKQVDICKRTHDEEQEMINTFMELLTRFKINWTSLRPIMKSTDAVILGLAVIVILLGGGFVPQDLNFYVDSKGFAAMLVFPMDHEYRVVMTELQPYHGFEMEYPRSTIILTLRYRAEGEKIDLIGTMDEHVFSVITQFHSTVAMN